MQLSLRAVHACAMIMVRPCEVCRRPQ